jgi:LmbE family N-acetylglucosaminyl deacetylase
MRELSFNFPSPLHVLCLGAHCDDIEIGCGGTILHWIARQKVARVDWAVFSSDDIRGAEAARSAEVFLAGAPQKNVELYTFADGFFPYAGADLKTAFEALKREIDPDVIFTHHRDDQHQDHRLVAELTWNTWRRHLILEYEIPKYDGNPFSPNVYVPLDEGVVRRKVETVTEVFASQQSKHWFAPDTFMATLRLRGVECASPTRFAEAFVGRKVTLL